MRLFFNNRQGQGMVEAVFAIGILLIVVSAVLALTTSNVSGNQESEFQIVANNLAREGIEVVRSLRDTNWLSGRPWTIRLFDSVDNRARVEFTETQNTWSLNFTTIDYKLYISPSGLYSHQLAGNKLSVYERYVVIEYICDNAGSEQIAFPCAPSEQQVGIKITAHVDWLEHNRQRHIKLEDLLYAWK